jgi:chemotaxis protein CheD
MRAVIVGIADCQVSDDLDSVLVTYALGSCIAVMIHDPVAHVSGMLHFMLPDSSIDGPNAGQRPYMFADTGIPQLFHQAYAMGAEKKRMTVRLAGGAQVMDDHGVFDIGKRNYTATRKILWKAGVMIQAEAVGGTTSRTVRQEVATGTTWLRGAGGIEQELGAPSKASKGIVYAVPSLNRG